MMTFNITWIDRGVEPHQKPNPKYPDGIDLDMSVGQKMTCVVPLAHPAPRCGYWRIQCNDCHFAVTITAAGRKDDPRSVRLPCGGGERSRLQ